MPQEAREVKEFYEFGPFRVDPNREILYRDDQAVPLTPKTFQILLVLLRHGQDVVTKDNLMKAVWPDTFVEEANLSRNIFMLRKALGESASENRYVVTIPGRGYRLAEKVRVVSEQQEVSILAANRSEIQIQVTETSPWRGILVAAIVVVVLGAIAARLFWHRVPLLGQKDKVLLAAFSNSTGDSVFDGTLRQGLAIQLEQSPYLSLISDEHIQNTLRLMGQPANAPLTSQLARDVCDRTSGAAVLTGSIASLGSQYVVGLRAINCRTGELLDEEQAQAAKKEDVLNALSAIASRFRTRIGESLAAVAQHEKPLAEATTPSLEALKAFSNGVQLVSTAPTQAVPFFQRAIELDPNFAIAYAWLARQYADMNEFSLSAEMARKAYELRDRASDPEKFWIMADYETAAVANMERAQQVCEVWAKTYPRDPVPHDMLAGIILPTLGKYDAGLMHAQQSIERDPEFGVSYSVLTAGYRTLNRIEEAQKTIDEAFRRNIVRPETILEQYNLAFLKHDSKGMERASKLSQEDSVAEEWIAESAALSAAYLGRMHEARNKFALAGRLAEQGGRRDSLALYKAAEAVVEGWFGNKVEAEAGATAALKISNNAEVEYGSALAFTLAGDGSRAAALTDNLSKRFPEATSPKFNYVPVLRGLAALQRGDSQKSLESLQVAAGYELGSPDSAVHANFGALYPSYVRGLALLASQRPAEAAAEFRKVEDHAGVMINDPVGVMARLQLARSYSLLKDTVKARFAYDDFFTLWKDADPGSALLKQAKAEYSKLQ